MEKKQCPHCGQYVAADRTYCMNCGTTLGIRCPDCKKVLPVGSKVCDACGHSFVRKKQRKTSDIFATVRKYAKPILLVGVILLFVVTIVTAALPSVSFSLTQYKASAEPKPEDTALWKASGFTLAGYFLGGHPEAVTGLIGQSAFEESATGLTFALYGVGLGWLILIVSAALCLCALLPNVRRLGKKTSLTLIPLTGCALFGAGLATGLHFTAHALLSRGASVAWPLVEEAAETGTKLSRNRTVTEWAVSGEVPAVIVTVLALLVFVVAIYLYFAVYRKAEADEIRPEFSLGRILKTPFVTVSRLSRKFIRRLAGNRKRRGEDEKTVTCTKHFTFYLVLLGVALVFTQALLSKISNIFFWFIFLLPSVLLVYTLVARSALSVSMLSESVTTEKNAPHTYEFVVENSSILAFPFIEACVSIPQSNSVRCTERTIRLAMPPKASYHMKNTVCFRFRGTYEIGVRCFYVYDFFRIFRVQVPIENITTVYVLPRRLSLEETLAQSVSDSTARTVRSPLVVDRLEVSDIREYRAGDSLKSVHWKLSSKSETFVVKDYNTGTSNQTVIYCDLAAHFPDEPPKKKPVLPDDGSMILDENGNPVPAKKKKLSRKEKKAAKRAALDKQLLETRRKRRDESPETRALSDAELEVRLEERNMAASHMDNLTDTSAPADTTATAPETASPVEEVHDVHELATPALYDDMNEYLADGVVELTIANVLAELHQGHEVLLIWFDRRSDTGVYAFPLRGAEEFERIYHLFGTAPLCVPEKAVSLLTAMAGDTESAKQMFTTSAMDDGMLTSLSNLPGVSDAANFGSSEVLLYNPEERFRYPRERALYLEGCREQLSASGLTLMVAGGTASDAEGGMFRE